MTPVTAADAVRDPSGVPVCLALEPDPVLAFMHATVAAEHRRTAVLICPPFGWQDMCSYRARRRWAQAFAQAGFPAARFDLPGTGDSGGSPRDPGRLEAWTDAVTATAGWLRESTDCDRVAVLGIGLGGLVACRAVALGAAIDDLILWAVPARGRTLVRELRAYAAIVSERYPTDAQGPALPDGAFEVTGFLLSAETAAELEQLRLNELAVPRADERRVLLLDRGEIEFDRRLREHFEQSGAKVTTIHTRDYDALMAHPQEAVAPDETIERTVAWLTEGDLGEFAQGYPASAPKIAKPSMELVQSGVRIQETPIRLDIGPSQTVGILTGPVHGPREEVCAVLLNGGALRRIGPNRTWVEIARRWAARGVCTIRIDFEGIGDSDGDARRHVNLDGLYSPRMTDETLELLERLRGRGLPDRFVLVGLCSGAYWALHTALADQSIEGAFMINLYSFHFSKELVAERDRRATVAGFRAGVVRRLLRGGISQEQFRRVMRGLRGLRARRRGSGQAAQAAEIEVALEK
ncbi:MAG: alpha/beta fold hydrolase, partial [Solirubrobacteraceae bacterium]